MTLASDDLPLPLGPISPVMEPGWSVKLTPRTTGTSAPGGTAVTFSASILPAGRGNSVPGPSSSPPKFSSSALTRRQACLAPTNPRQAPMPCSIGASARPMMMEPAIIMPGVRSPASTR